MHLCVEPVALFEYLNLVSNVASTLFFDLNLSCGIPAGARDLSVLPLSTKLFLFYRQHTYMFYRAPSPPYIFIRKAALYVNPICALYLAFMFLRSSIGHHSCKLIGLWTVKVFDLLCLDQSKQLSICHPIFISKHLNKETTVDSLSLVSRRSVVLYIFVFYLFWF